MKYQIRKTLYTALLSLLILPSMLVAEIRPLASLEDITPILKTHGEVAPQDVLMLFDIDYTLCVPKEKAMQVPNVNSKKAIRERLWKALSPEKKSFSFHSALISTQPELVEPKSPTLIRAWQKEGYKTIAFTALWTGPLKQIPRLEVWRYKALRTLGLTFEKAFPKYKDVSDTDLPPYLNHFPCFYRGVLYANGDWHRDVKGIVLLSFLKKVHYSPRVVIMVDDSKQNLEAVERKLQELDSTICFIGFHYLTGLQYASGPISEEAFTSFWAFHSAEAQKMSFGAR